jgi:hypothetical protein
MRALSSAAATVDSMIEVRLVGYLPRRHCNRKAIRIRLSREGSVISWVYALMPDFLGKSCLLVNPILAQPRIASALPPRALPY